MMTAHSDSLNKPAGAAPGLTEQEAGFVLDVFQQPAYALFPIAGANATPEQLRLVRAIGHGKWIPQTPLRALLMQALTAAPASEKISTWRERIGQAADFPLHMPTDVERAMVAEIADGHARIVNLEAALRYYADGNHFEVSDTSAWDTCSGEPTNFYFDDAGTAQVEDGSLAKMVLAGAPMPQDDEEIPVVIPKSDGAAAPVSQEATITPPITCWSANEEEFNATSLGELLDRCEHLQPGSTVWVGEAETPAAERLIDADDVMTTMGERAAEIAGEYADGYPDVSAEAESELNGLLAGWIEKHARPTFWTVANMKPYVLTAADFTAEQLAGKTGGFA